ncbi:MAG: outer membrane protein transport protein [Lysobacter sp.]
MTIAHAASASAFQQRNALDTSALFDPSRVYLELGTSQLVDGNVHVRDAIGRDQGGRDVASGRRSADYSEAHGMPFFTLKLKPNEASDCMLDSRMAVNVDNDPPDDWIGRYHLQRLRLKVRQDSLTCSYGFKVGGGKLRLIGGYLRDVADLDKNSLVARPGLPPGVRGAIQANDTTHAWRWGVSYEKPELGLRAVLQYQDRVPLALQGTQFIYTADGRPLAGGAARIDAALPKTWQLDLQSGIKPGWVAMFSASWQQWSELQNLPVKSALGNGLGLYFRDSWTFTGGVGHAFSPALSMMLSLSYMQGASDRANTRYGHPTLPYSDNWTLGLSGKYKLDTHVALKAGVYATRLSGAYFIDGGPSINSFEGGRYDSSWLYTVGGSVAVGF